jgi:hypothetical protein
LSTQEIRATEEMVEPDAAALRVETEGDVITITKPGTQFRVSYQREPKNRQLVLTYSWVPPSKTTPAVTKFRAAAWRAACDKARELGWFV